MSGLLQRLLDRSLASAPPVHPRARLESAWSAPRESAGVAIGPMQSDPTTPAAYREPTRSTAGEDVENFRSLPDSGVAALATEQMPNESRDLNPDARASRALKAGSVRVTEAGLAAAAADEPEPRFAGLSSRIETSTRRESRGTNLPAALLPEPAVAARESGRVARSGESRADQRALLAAAATPVPDVHIHIGRVELTALTAPGEARGKASARATSPTLSLDDYLHGRKGRAS